MTTRLPSAFLVACVLSTLTGCGPLTLSATFGEDDRPPRETTVAGDPGAAAKFVMIDVRGLIADTSSEGIGTLLLSPENPVDQLTFRLEKAARDTSVKGVVLRINSPGGTVTASDIMYREVRRFAETTGKPVVASLGEVAASGGYYLALAADEIVAEPTSITGSIGVIIQTVNVSDGLGRIGIRARNLVSGPNKDLGDPLTPAKEEHYAILQGLVDEYYEQFKARVIERRTPAGLKSELVNELTDGRVVTGARAVQAGLADHEGGVREALAAAMRLAKVDSARLVKYTTRGPRPRSPYATAPTLPQGQAAPTGTEINLIQLQLGQGTLWSAGPNVYYLWTP